MSVFSVKGASIRMFSHAAVISRGGKDETVNGLEFELLRLLLPAHPRAECRAIEVDDLARKLFRAAGGNAGRVYALMSTLRGKLPTDAIITVRGKGYMLSPTAIDMVPKAIVERPLDDRDLLAATDMDATAVIAEARADYSDFVVRSCATADIASVQAEIIRVFREESRTVSQMLDIHRRTPASHILLRDSRSGAMAGFACVYALSAPLMGRFLMGSIDEKDMHPSQFQDISGRSITRQLYFDVLMLFQWLLGDRRAPLALRMLYVGIAAQLLKTALNTHSEVDLYTAAWTKQGHQLVRDWGFECVPNDKDRQLFRRTLGRAEAEAIVLKRALA